MIVELEHSGERIDRYLATAGLGLTRSQAQKLIEDGRVMINGVVVRSSVKVKEGDEAVVDIPEPTPMNLEPEDIPLHIIYEDADVVALDKPAGMVVHPSAGHDSGTLVHALLQHCAGELSGVGGVARPGIVHRLDKDTSGLIIVAKNDAAHHALSEQLISRELSRIYVAVVKGSPKTREGTIESSIGRHPYERKKMAVLKSGGRNSVTGYKVTQTLERASVVELSLVTGRTHQIRVHMQSINCPVIGDPVYSRGVGRYPIRRQALHAWKMRFNHPRDGRLVELSTPIPDDMARLIVALKGDPTPYR